jgi:hypothetical protein
MPHVHARSSLTPRRSCSQNGAKSPVDREFDFMPFLEGSVSSRYSAVDGCFLRGLLFLELLDATYLGTSLHLSAVGPAFLRCGGASPNPKLKVRRFVSPIAE